jgi:hypothetical protein
VARCTVDFAWNFSDKITVTNTASRCLRGP